MKYIRNALCMLICAISVTAFMVSAVCAHSINGVDSITSGKKIEFGSTSLTSGSVTVSHSLAGTPTCALFTADYASLGNGSGTTFKAKITGTNSVTFYGYNGDTGNTSTSNFDGYYFIAK